MRLEHLEYLICLAETGSTTKASEKLLTSRQNVSKMIRQLEDEMEAELFIRSPQGVKLTEAGKIMLKAAQKSVAELYQARNAISKLKRNTQLGGELYLYSTAMTNITTTGSLITAFQNMYPNVTLHLLHHEALDTLAQVALHPAAIGVVPLLTNQEFQFIYAPYLGNITAYPLQQDSFVCLVGNNSPLAKQKTISLARLVKNPLVINIKDDEENCLLRLYRRFGEVTIALTTPNPMLQAQAIAAGNGVAVTSLLTHNSYQMQSISATRETTTIPFREDMHCNMCLITAKNAQLSPVGQAFKDFTLQYFQKAQR